MLKEWTIEIDKNDLADQCQANHDYHLMCMNRYQQQLDDLSIEFQHRNTDTWTFLRDAHKEMSREFSIWETFLRRPGPRRQLTFSDYKYFYGGDPVENN
jgi:hypothetical protein